MELETVSEVELKVIVTAVTSLPLEVKLTELSYVIEF